MKTYSARKFGASTAASATRNTKAINAGMAICDEGGYELTIEDEYLVNGPLVWPGETPRLRGLGTRSVIRPSGTDYDWLTVGDGSGNGKLGPCGWIRDLYLRGQVETNAPAGTKAGVLMNSATFVEVRNVWVAFAPIGFSLCRNNFGASFYNCRTLFDECRIGLFLEGSEVGVTEGAGNDIAFYNCWFHGRQTAIWAEGSQGFYHFHGGQLLGGVGATTSDDRGACLTTGAALDTTTPMGSVGFSFVGTTFERATHGWSIRHFGAGTHPSGLTLHCTMTSFFGSDEAIGVIKLTGGYNDHIALDLCAANGDFSSAVPIVIEHAGGSARPQYYERGTRGIATFNGQSRNLSDSSLFLLSNMQKAHVENMLMVMHNGQALRFNTDGTEPLYSSDRGATFPKKIVPVNV